MIKIHVLFELSYAWQLLPDIIFNHFLWKSQELFSASFIFGWRQYFFRSIFDEINDGKELKSCNSVKTFTYGRGCDSSLMELRFFCSVQKQVFSCQAQKICIIILLVMTRFMFLCSNKYNIENNLFLNTDDKNNILLIQTWNA